MCLIMKTPNITPEEVGIIKEAQAGKMSAFNKLFYKYKPFVEKVLYSYLKDWDEARDLTNVVFMKVYRKLSKFTAYDSFGGWLRILSKNTAIDYLRKLENTGIVMDVEEEGLTSNESITSEGTEIVNRITFDQLLSEFDNLSPIARKVCDLYYDKNMRVKDISRALNIPTGTIKSMLFRTREKIKQQLNKKQV